MIESFPLAPGPDSWLHLHPSVKKVWVFRAVIVGLIFMAMLGGLDYLIFRDLPRWPLPKGVLGAGIALLFTLWSLAILSLSYKNYRFFVGEDDLAVEHGIWWKSCRFVSRGRIQHVDVSSGPVERMLGLSKISVQVAGGMHSAVSIPGISHEDAENLRTKLMHGVTPIAQSAEDDGFGAS